MLDKYFVKGYYGIIINNKRKDTYAKNTYEHRVQKQTL